MKKRQLGIVVIVLGVFVRAPGGVLSAGLPDDYFQLMASGLESIAPAPELRNPTSYMFAATVLYTKQHPANPRASLLNASEAALSAGRNVHVVRLRAWQLPSWSFLLRIPSLIRGRGDLKVG